MDQGKLKKILDFIHLRFRAQGTELGIYAEEVIQEARKGEKARSQRFEDHDQDTEPQEQQESGH